MVLKDKIWIIRHILYPSDFIVFFSYDIINLIINIVNQIDQWEKHDRKKTLEAFPR